MLLIFLDIHLFFNIVFRQTLDNGFTAQIEALTRTTFD